MRNFFPFGCLELDCDLEYATHVVQHDHHLFYIKDCEFYVRDITEQEIFDANIKTEITGSKVINFKYIEFEKIVVITTDREFLTYVLSRKSMIRCPSEKKILAAEWNPSESGIAVVHDDKSVCWYGYNSGTMDFEKKKESSLDDDPVKASVYVGWGSKATQFKGKGVKITDAVEERDVPDYLPPKISWRGNGSLFVVNFCTDRGRKLRVFNEELEPQYESKVIVGLQTCISFKGEGNLIACAVQDSTHNDIVLFEKNCLERKTFPFPKEFGKIEMVKFHPSKKILTVMSVGKLWYITILVYSNGEWIIKQVLYYDKAIIDMTWLDNGDSYVTLQVCSSNSVKTFRYCMAVARSNNNFVAVINGRSVGYVNFNNEVVAPPYVSFTYWMDHPVNRVLFFGDNLSMIIDADMNISTVKLYEDKVELISTIHLVFKEHPLCNYKVLFSGENAEITFQTLPEVEVIAGNNTITFKASLHSVHDLVELEFFETVMVKFKDEEFEIALSITNVLYINRKPFSEHITSFYVENNYLFFTITDNRLYTIKIDANVLTSMSEGLLTLTDCFYRDSVGNGIIICNCPTGTVLQVPRGDIKVVISQIVEIDKLENLLNLPDWTEAINHIRSAKLNSNLLIDLNIERFCKRIETFVTSFKKSLALNNTCLEFKDENVLETVYKMPYSADIVRSETTVTKKDAIGTIIKYLENNDPEHYITAIALLTIKHLSIDDALSHIYNLFQIREDSPNLYEECSYACRQLLQYKFEKQLYEASFKQYNFEFVRFIATCCSMDPKIFDPELNRLSKISSIYELRFEMNLLAKDFKGAYFYLLNLEEKYDNEFVANFIKKHKLTKFAYQKVPRQSKYYTTICCLYGSYLSSKKLYQESALLYTRAGLVAEALEEHIKALNYPLALALMDKLNTPKVERNKKILNMIEGLINSKKIEDAAFLHECHLEDTTVALHLLVDHKRFTKASELIQRKDLKKESETIFVPAVHAALVNIELTIREWESDFDNYYSRLIQVRKEKLSQKVRYEDYDSDCDLYSESASTRSSRSSRSNRSTLSSRNRRKDERKRTDLKQGGKYEDIALMRALYLKIEDTIQIGKDVREICLNLDTSKWYEAAQELHQMLSKLQNKMKSSLAEIWPKSVIDPNAGPDSQHYCKLSVNYEFLDQKFKSAPSLDNVDTWQLDMFV